MEEERTNLVPRLQQDAYLAAAQPGSVAGELNLNLIQANDAQFSSGTGITGRHFSFSLPSTFPHPAGNHGVINEYSNESYAPSTESNIFAQELPAAGIPNRYLADPFDDPNASRFDANASLSAEPHAFSKGALNLTSSRYAEGGYGGIPAAHQYYSDPSNYPFATDAAFNGTDTFATGPTTYTNGYVTANNPLPMPVSNNPIVPLDIGSMTEGPSPLSPNIYNTGQAIANNSLPVSNNPIVPWDIGFMTEDPFALSPNIYTTGQASANNTLPVPTSNGALIPVDIGPPIPQQASCKKCNQTFRRQSDLDRHAKKHGPKNVKCQVQGCKYRTYRKDKLSDHMKCRHPAAGTRST